MRREYLDGLRGWASLFVLFSHLGPMFLLSTKKMTSIPFVMDGQLAVYIFFVLSGYVLSIGFLEKGNPEILKSLAIRRYTRLTIPIIASCSIALILVSIGAMKNLPAGIAAESPWLESFYRFPTSTLDMIRYSIFDVYADKSANSYNAVLWTMQYELTGSMLVLGGLYALRGAKLRTVGYFISIAATTYLQSPLAAFALGVMLADLTCCRKTLSAKALVVLRRASWFTLVCALTLAMARTGFIASPAGLSLIAAVILASIICNPCIQKTLSTRISLRLGHLSFPLYLTHLLVICSASSWIYLSAAEQGLSRIEVSAITALSTVALSLFGAMAFAPIEHFAIRLSQRISNTLIHRRPKRIAG